MVSLHPFLTISDHLAHVDCGLIISASYTTIDSLGGASYAGHYLAQKLNPVRAV